MSDGYIGCALIGASLVHGLRVLPSHPNSYPLGHRMCLILQHELGKLATKAQGSSAALIVLPITREAMRRLVPRSPVLMGLVLSAIVHGDTRSNLKIALPGSRATHWNLHFLMDSAHRRREFVSTWPWFVDIEATCVIGW